MQADNLVIQDAKRRFRGMLGLRSVAFERIVKLKGLGYAISGNFSTDQMVIVLTKI